MSWRIYTPDGKVTEFGDDTTRKVTTYDPATGAQTGQRDYTAAENAAADAQARAAATLTSLEPRVTRLERAVFPPPTTPPTGPTDPTVKNWAAWGGAVPAGAYLLDTDSKVYQNVSGNVLTTPPTGMPGGPGPWTHLWKPLVAAGGGAWAAGVAYKTGDLATYQASTYKCLQGHTSQTGWEPPAVPAIWQKQ